MWDLGISYRFVPLKKCSIIDHEHQLMFRFARVSSVFPKLALDFRTEASCKFWTLETRFENLFPRLFGVLKP